jgi:hypothetical protein
VACAAEASMPVVPVAGGQSPRRAAMADLAAAPLRSWTHAVRLSVVASASTAVATNAVFCKAGLLSLHPGVVSTAVARGQIRTAEQHSILDSPAWSRARSLPIVTPAWLGAALAAQGRRGGARAQNAQRFRRL